MVIIPNYDSDNQKPKTKNQNKKKQGLNGDREDETFGGFVYFFIFLLVTRIIRNENKVGCFLCV